MIIRYLLFAPWPVISEEGDNAIVLKDYLKANNIPANWQQKPKNIIDEIKEIHRTSHSTRAYDLQGRLTNHNTNSRIIIVNGKKVLK